MKRHSPVSILLVLILLGAGTLVWAQGQESSSPLPEQQTQVQEAPQQVWSQDQLNNLVAPIALYPDPLLGQMLVASTYPLEIVEVNQWLEQNRNLSGQALVDAARQQPWDPSVQALVAVPDALAKLNQDIRWTTDLGNAFLAQQADVMNAVQQMRSRAQGNGRLSSSPQQTVTTQEEGGQQVIVIQPADPQVIYVPAYDPVYIWGPPVYGYYPPLYYSGFGFSFGRAFNFGLYFDDWGGWGGWGWGPSWSSHYVHVNDYFFRRHGYHYGSHDGYRGGFRGRTIWAHDSGHRLGVPYGNHQVATRFRGDSNGSRNWFRGGSGSRVAAAPYANRYAGRTGGQGFRSTAPQAQRFQNPSRQRYQAPEQYRSAPQQYRSAPQQYRSAPQQYRSAPQQYRSAPQQYRSAPQQYRSAPQVSSPRISGGGGSGGSRGGFSSGRGSSGGASRGSDGSRGGKNHRS